MESKRCILFLLCILCTRTPIFALKIFSNFKMSNDVKYSVGHSLLFAKKMQQIQYLIYLHSFSYSRWLVSNHGKEQSWGGLENLSVIGPFMWPTLSHVQNHSEVLKLHDSWLPPWFFRIHSGWSLLQLLLYYVNLIVKDKAALF